MTRLCARRLDPLGCALMPRGAAATQGGDAADVSARVGLRPCGGSWRLRGLRLSACYCASTLQKPPARQARPSKRAAVRFRQGLRAWARQGAPAQPALTLCQLAGAHRLDRTASNLATGIDARRRGCRRSRATPITRHTTHPTCVTKNLLSSSVHTDENAPRSISTWKLTSSGRNQYCPQKWDGKPP